MAKCLKASFPQKCIGCELCVFEAQRQLKKVGFEGALIRILRNKKDDKEFLEYSIDMDARVNSLDIESIRSVCPTEVFEILNEDAHELG